MKKVKFFKFTILIVTIFISHSANSQLKVLSSGRVDIYNQQVISGTINTDVLDLVNYATNLGSGYDLIWANYSYSQPNNPGLMKLASAYSSKFVVKSNGHVGICKTNPDYELDVIGEGRINGSIIMTSDERLKENIKPISEVKSSLLKMEGIRYNFKHTVEDYLFAGRGMFYEKDSIPVRKNEFGNEFYQRKRTGFVAQDVKKLFPELVYEDSLGIMSIDYIGFIPLIVETIKDQDKQIRDQGNKLNELEDRIKALESMLNDATKKGTEEVNRGTVEGSNAMLYQNSPNPFNLETKIEYFLPDNTNKATINIYTLNGTPIQNIEINQMGSGFITIKSAELNPGMYLYSLIANGAEVDTKRMILTE